MTDQGAVMSDLTILYYSAQRIAYPFMCRVQQYLIWSAYGLPLDADDPGAEFFEGKPELITITQKPMQWGRNICVGAIGASIYNVYRQILVGAKAATTPYVACCEDDTLYSASHFAHRPALDTFAYNLNRYVITRRQADDGKGRHAFFYWRRRTQMAMCIAPRQFLIETLEERFEKYPTPVPHEIAKKTGWGEPGRYEKNLGLTPRKLEYFRSAQPNVTFNHGDSLMGRRAVKPDDVIAQAIEPWGEANALWRQVYGE